MRNYLNLGRDILNRGMIPTTTNEPKVGRIVRSMETSLRSVEDEPRRTNKAGKKVPVKISDCSSTFRGEADK